jgi:hypothetical protein
MAKAYTKKDEPKSVYLEYAPWGKRRERKLIEHKNFGHGYFFDISQRYLIDLFFTRLPDKPNEGFDEVWEFDFEKFEWVKRNQDRPKR